MFRLSGLVHAFSTVPTTGIVNTAVPAVVITAFNAITGRIASAMPAIAGTVSVTGAVPAATPRMPSVRVVGTAVIELHTGCPQLVLAIEHPAHPHTLIERQCRGLLADDHGTLPQRHLDACHHQLLSVAALYQPLDHRRLHTASKRQARVWAGLRHFQLASGPLPTYQHFPRRCHTGSQLQPLEAASTVYRTDGTGLPEPRRPLDTAGYHFTLGIAQATDPDRLARAQPFSHPRPCSKPHGLAHDPQGGRCIGQCRQRPFVNVEDRDAPCLQAAFAGKCLNRDNLADCQVSATGRRTVFTHRYVLAKVHFQAIDANRGEPGDGADDARATGTARAQDRCAGTACPAVIDEGAVHTVGHRTGPTRAAGTLRQRRTGATHSAVFAAYTGTTDTARPGPGTTNTAGKLQARRPRHTHFVTADTYRCCGHLGRRHQVQPETQDQCDHTEAAREGSHGSGVFDKSGSVVSV